MIKLDTHYRVDAGEIAGWVPHSWWRNIRQETSSLEQLLQELNKWGGTFHPAGADEITFEDEQMAALFLLRWS